VDAWAQAGWILAARVSPFTPKSATEFCFPFEDHGGVYSVADLTPVRTAPLQDARECATGRRLRPGAERLVALRKVRNQFASFVLCRSRASNWL
jgi:hypothetical protein